MEEAPEKGEEVRVVSEDGVEKGGDDEVNEEKDLITLEDSETESSNTFAHKKRSPVGRGDEPSLGSLPNKRKRNTPNRFDPAAPATPAKKMSSKEASTTGVVTPETARLKHGERRQSRADSQLNMKRYEDAKKSLCAMPETTEEEVVAALEKVGPPYGLQTTFHAIEHARRKAENWTEPKTERFEPHVGMRIRKVSEGKIYFGTVTQDSQLCRLDEDEGSRAVQMWEVTFDGGDGCVDDMDWHELFRCRVDRPRKPAPCRGRQLQFLELFSGQGIVTQEFCDRKWKVMSIDSSKSSSATLREDILKIDPENLDFVPDCIWASPPCETYSNLSGGAHRSSATGEFEKSEEARLQNYFFQRMSEIMHWAKKKHPHLIVVIENPVGSLKYMPLMKEFARTFGLYNTIVHYCAFGRDDKKPTNIWTNDFGLKSSLSEFTCDNKCPYASGIHPIGVRGHGSKYSAAAIPQPLAEEVAEYVNSKFYQDRIRYKPASPLNDL